MVVIPRNGLDNERFRRTLLGGSLELWGHNKEACDSVALDKQNDKIRWTLMGNGKYMLSLVTNT